MNVIFDADVVEVASDGTLYDLRLTLNVTNRIRGDIPGQVQAVTSKHGSSCGVDLSVRKRITVYAPSADEPVQVNLCNTEVHLDLAPAPRAATETPRPGDSTSPAATETPRRDDSTPRATVALIALGALAVLGCLAVGFRRIRRG